MDCSDPNHPARDITIMGPAQMGKTIMVLNPVIGYTIAMDPCNCMFLTGHAELSDEASAKLDFMIQNCGLQPLIMPSVMKLKNNRTGDTLKKKEFRGGDLKMGSVTNHNLLRQHTIKKSITDDLDAAKMKKTETGSTVEKVKSRTKAHEHDCKRYWVSTPQIMGHSNIEAQLNLSDRRRWMVECPKCASRGGERIIDLRMPFQVVEGADGMAGLTWKLDGLGRPDPASVGYICQLCGEWFSDRGKKELLLSGKWVATQEASELYHQGYEINGLYAPHGMTSWYTLAAKWVQFNPPGAPRKEAEWQTYLNDDVGVLYEPPTDTPKATELMKMCRDYKIGVIPESVSESDGNGDIILITCAMDCNGLLNDARIDYEIRAWSRGGQKYSVKAGSLGTFIPRQSAIQKENTVRQRWSYETGRENSVWKLVDELLGTPIDTDTCRKMSIFITGLDAGYLTDHVFNYIDRSQFSVIGLMGDKENELVRVTENMPVFVRAKSRHNLYMLNVNMIKDDVANMMRLPWDRTKGEKQPHQFMNFPQYGYKEFFAHYESEERRENDKGYFGWQKKGPSLDNHMFDCAIYNEAVKEILLWRVFKEGMKRQSWTWKDFADACAPRGTVKRSEKPHVGKPANRQQGRQDVW